MSNELSYSSQAYQKFVEEYFHKVERMPAFLPSERSKRCELEDFIGKNFAEEFQRYYEPFKNSPAYLAWRQSEETKHRWDRSFIFRRRVTLEQLVHEILAGKEQAGKENYQRALENRPLQPRL